MRLVEHKFDQDALRLQNEMMINGNVPCITGALMVLTNNSRLYNSSLEASCGVIALGNSEILAFSEQRAYSPSDIVISNIRETSVVENRKCGEYAYFLFWRSSAMEGSPTPFTSNLFQLLVHLSLCAVKGLTIFSLFVARAPNCSR